MYALRYIFLHKLSVLFNVLIHLTNIFENLKRNTIDLIWKTLLQRLNTAENILTALKQRYSGRSAAISFQSSNDGAIKSLELLRSNIQPAFDKEIDLIVKKFVDAYFVLAIKNIKENLGEHCLQDDQLKSISISLLEHSKSQYLTTNIKKKHSGDNTPSRDVEYQAAPVEATRVQSCSTTTVLFSYDRDIFTLIFVCIYYFFPRHPSNEKKQIPKLYPGKYLLHLLHLKRMALQF